MTEGAGLDDKGIPSCWADGAGDCIFEESVPPEHEHGFPGIGLLSEGSGCAGEIRAICESLLSFIYSRIYGREIGSP